MPYFTKSGNILWDGFLVDITERKQAEDNLLESEDKYRSLITNIPDIVWTTDINGNTNFISENVKDIYGFSREEIYKSGSKLFLDRIHPEEIESVKNAFKNLFLKDIRYNIEYRIKRKDGEWIWLQDRALKIYEKDGIKYADGLFSDITERKHAEQQIKDNLLQIELITANTPNIIWKTDIDKKGNFINTYISEAANEFLTLPVGTINNSWEKYFSYVKPEYLPPINGIFKQAIANPGKHISFDYEVTKANGETAWFSSKGKVHFENNKLTVYGSTIDITERKQAEEELKKRMNELEIFNDATVERELKMIELKKEINELLTKTGQKPKYEIFV